jgi:hypothetical protein
VRAGLTSRIRDLVTGRQERPNSSTRVEFPTSNIWNRQCQPLAEQRESRRVVAAPAQGEHHECRLKADFASKHVGRDRGRRPSHGDNAGPGADWRTHDGAPPPRSRWQQPRPEESHPGAPEPGPHLPACHRPRQAAQPANACIASNCIRTQPVKALMNALLRAGRNQPVARKERSDAHESIFQYR